VPAEADTARSSIGQEVFSSADIAYGVTVDVNTETMRAVDELPRGKTGGVARPNILMFGDIGFASERRGSQANRYAKWRANGKGQPLVAVEMGAGSQIPTVRHECARCALEQGGTLIRINPREPDGPPGTISVPMGAKDALLEIERRMQAL
jgi:hypothetical protein